MSSFGWGYPPGVEESDVCPENYVCEKCESEIAESEIHGDASDENGFVICKACALQLEAEQAEEEESQQP